jgi:hypothetical protein
MALQEIAEIEQRALQYVLVYEKERDQQSSDSSVSIEKRVDRLELCMRDSTVDEWRQRFVMDEALEVVQRVEHLRRRWRHECRCVQWRVLCANPILRRSELTGIAFVASYARQ